MQKASVLEQRLWAIAAAEMASAEMLESSSELGEIARRVVKRDAAEHPIDAMNAIIFGELGFVREVESEVLPFVLLPSVVQQRRGTCVGLGQLYLTVARRAGVPLQGVLVPGHFFVRYEGPGGSRNVELLRRGESMPTTWYRQRYPTQGEVRAYHRPLTDGETVAVLHYNVGNAQRRAHRIDAALESYTAAALLFDDFPQAHASRGLVLQLLGDLQAAAAAYRRADELDPQLEGLAQNIELLRRERLRADTTRRIP